MSVHSDWDDWLPRAIADASPDGLDCWYLGCNGFALKAADGTTAFVDPYLGTGDPPRTVRMIPVPFAPTDVRSADAIFVTHEHTDHVHGPSQAPILERTGATLFAPAASLAVVEEEGWTDEWDVDADQLVEVAPGDVVDLGSLTVHVEAGVDADAAQPVTYVVENGSRTFFHGGDSKPGAALGDIGARYDIDLGALAFGTVGMLPDKQTREPKRTRWYADENEVVEMAGALRLDRLLPTHWDMWKGLTADPTALYDHVRSFEYPRRLEVVEIGDRVTV